MAIPFVWQFYGWYWKLRTKLELNRRSPPDPRIISFGNFDEPSLEDPVSQLCTSSQIMSETYKRWCNLMRTPPKFSRKQWEFVYILQVLRTNGLLQPGKKGLGFGCGREPLPGVFAKHGCQVTATDLGAESARQKGWVHTMQHAASLAQLYHASHWLVDETAFKDLVDFEIVDMNQVPQDHFGAYDFVWSSCALEHLGSLEAGLIFIENSEKCLKPGGVAVHTTEFNLSSKDVTMEHEQCCIYTERDMRNLIVRLEQSGFQVAPLNLNIGGGNVDHVVDTPPFSNSPHLKLELSGHVSTSIGLIVFNTFDA